MQIKLVVVVSFRKLVKYHNIKLFLSLRFSRIQTPFSCFGGLRSLDANRGKVRLSLQPWVSRSARDSRHLHGWAHGFGYCLEWPIRDKPPEICGAECGHNLAGFRAIFDNYPRWWTLRGLTVIFRMLAHTLFTSLLLIVSRNNSVLLWICNDVTDMPPNPCAQPWRRRESRAHRDTHAAGNWA